MITVRVATNTDNEVLRGRLVVWFLKYKFTYNQLTHDWTTMLGYPEILWSQLFYTAEKFEALVTISFDKSADPKAIMNKHDILHQPK